MLRLKSVLTYAVKTRLWKLLNAFRRTIIKNLKLGFKRLSISQINVATNDSGVTEGDEMSREEVVSNGMAAITQAIADQLGVAYDGGLAEAPTGGDPSKIYSQEEFDAKIAEMLAADELMDQEALAAQASVFQGQLDLVNAALVEMTAKKDIAEGAVQGFKDKVDGLQSALDILKSLITPVAPPPVEEPTPETPVEA